MRRAKNALFVQQCGYLVAGQRITLDGQRRSDRADAVFTSQLWAWLDQVHAFQLTDAFSDRCKRIHDFRCHLTRSDIIYHCDIISFDTIKSISDRLLLSSGQEIGDPHFFRISINKLARDLVVPPNRISEIVNGKRAITADTALRLQRYFGVEAQFWLNLQTEYDLRMMKRKIWSDIERRIIPVKTSVVASENSRLA
jgi:addiction module HigA family antidote